MDSSLDSLDSREVESNNDDTRNDYIRLFSRAIFYRVDSNLLIACIQISQRDIGVSSGIIHDNDANL